ncbi:MAG: SBBP repeat-containing protein [Armatimonadetes bacterium]|nr:SBBP repeat-containing protein [Armatimonadota bacterium]
MLNFTRRLLRATACSVALIAAVPGVASPSAGPARSLNANLPLTFEKNTGRYAKEVQFVARSGGGALFLTSREMVLSLRKGDKSTALRLKLQGSNAGAVASGLDKQPGVVNYFLGNDAKKWRTNVPTYSRVKLAGVYPGIDLVTYGAGKSRTLEYDFVVKPGADASRIRMAVSGAKSLRTVGGKLIASTACGDVTLNRPYAYQTLNGVRKQVACSFTLERNAVGFQIARYDASRPLVVDPTLEYSTYLGGRALDNCRSFAVDAAGAAYIAGYTESGNYPATSGAYDTSIGGTQDAMVTKLAADGKSLVYSTYLGGGALDYGQALAVDSAGNAYIAGKTASPDFPTSTDAFDTTYRKGLWARGGQGGSRLRCRNHRLERLPDERRRL